LVAIQDYHLPEVRSDQRIGETRDCHGDIALGETHSLTTTSIVISSIRKNRKALLIDGAINWKKLKSRLRMNANTITDWISRLDSTGRFIDPLREWQDLVKYASYGKRQKLRFDALLAQDLLEITEILTLFLDETNNIETTVRNDDSWQKRVYGASLQRPFEMLEFQTNEFHLNPKPNAVIFTEGEEWRALKRLYEFYGYSPDLLGIELRSLRGEGNFSLANWQCFIEYMHKKQTLVYFAVDREGRTSTEARKLFKSKRRFQFDGLVKVLPRKDRKRLTNTMVSGFPKMGYRVGFSSIRRLPDGPSRPPESFEAVRFDPAPPSPEARPSCSPGR
jgi:hypothetical protein